MNRRFLPVTLAMLTALLGSTIGACSSSSGGSGGSPSTSLSGSSSVSGGPSAGATTASGQGGAPTSGAGGSAGALVSSGGNASGGSSNSAGAGGASAAGGNPAATGGSSASGGCPANATFCTGFESAGQPTGTTYHPSYETDGFDMFMKLTTTVTHSGSQALEVTGTDGYDWNMLSVPVPTATFWVRLYLRSSIDIGQADHNSYYQAMTGGGEPNDGENVEVSEQYCQVVLNRKDDVVLSIGGSAMCGTGVPPLAKETWHCMETFFDGPNGAVQVYADSTKIIDKSAWTVESYKTFSFGYLGFHGPGRTVWYDDVAVAPTRIGCL